MRFQKLSFTFLVLLFVSIHSLLFSQVNFPDNYPLYVDTTVAKVFIEIDPDSLAQIFHPDSLESDHEYPAKFIFDNGIIRDSLENVGFRLRGNTSRYSRKKSFKVAFNSFISGRKFCGVEKFNLNGEHNDPSIIRSKLCWDIFKDALVPGSRASHARLYINEIYYGLYINVEHIDENFVLSRFGNNDGNLYKCLWPANLAYLGNNPNLYKLTEGNRRVYELKTNKNLDDYTDLANFIRIINLTPDSLFIEEISRAFNVNGFLRGLAVDVATGSWDDYWFLENNYYLYHNTATGKFEYIPYDFDNTFGIWWDGILPGIDWGSRDVYNWGHPTESRPLTDRILSVPLFRERFSFYLKRLFDRIYNPGKLDSRIDSIHAMITVAAELDTFRTLDYGFTIQDFHNSYMQSLGGHVKYGLKPFISFRITTAWQQLIVTDIAPIISEVQNFPHHPIPGDSIFITARIEDEQNNPTVLLHYRIEDVWQSPLIFEDNGINHDGQAGDEVYGVSVPVQNQVQSITYYIEASDSSGNQITEPMDAPQSVFSITLGSTNTYALFINEFMASNDSTITDNFGEFEDWIEIYNGDTVAIDLGDKYLTDNLTNPDKWALPDTAISPGEFLLIWADDDQNQGPTHASFKLSAGGEQIGIFGGDSSGYSVVDSLSFGAQTTDISYGRNLDGGTNWQFFPEPTPGYTNNTTPIASKPANLPGQFLLYQNYPNPFNPATTIPFYLPSGPAQITMIITDVLGRKVRTVSRDHLQAGDHEIRWDGTNRRGENVVSGIYLISLKTERTDGTMLGRKSIKALLIR